MKKYFLIIVLVLSVFLVVACTSDGTDSGDNTSTAESSDGEEKVLKVARLSDAESLDPHFSSTINAASIFHENIYEGLVTRTESMEFAPMLAEDWEILDDTTWEFKLRQDVEFHDGTPFNSEAVKRTFDRVVDEAVAAPKAGLFAMLDEITIVDDYTVQFNLKEPYAPLLSILANHEGGILSPTAIDEYGSDLSQNPSGTGPFKLEDWSAGQELTLTRNDNYWGEAPALKKVIYSVVPEDATRISMVETGEVHIAEPIPVSEVERIDSSDQMNLYRSEAMGTVYVGFNVTSEHFQDERVRKAVNYAINNESILDGVFYNVGTAADSVLPSKVLGHHPDLEGYEYDVNKAKELLAEAGYPDGFSTTILTMDDNERVNLAEVIQSQLRGIGINLEVQVLEYGGFLNEITQGNSEMFISSWRNATGDADYLQYHLFHSSSKGSTGNYFFYGSDRVDELIEEGRRVTDTDERVEIYKELQEIQIEDEALLVPIHFLENVAATTKNVNGLYMSPSNYLMVKDVSLD